MCKDFSFSLVAYIANIYFKIIKMVIHFFYVVSFIFKNLNHLKFLLHEVWSTIPIVCVCVCVCVFLNVVSCSRTIYWKMCMSPTALCVFRWWSWIVSFGIRKVSLAVWVGRLTSSGQSGGTGQQKVGLLQQCRRKGERLNYNRDVEARSEDWQPWSPLSAPPHSPHLASFP